MYDILIFDPLVDDFRPFKTELGNRVSYETWAEAADAAIALKAKYPDEQFRVWYRTVKPRKQRKPR